MVVAAAFAASLALVSDIGIGIGVCSGINSSQTFFVPVDTVAIVEVVGVGGDTEPDAKDSGVDPDVGTRSIVAECAISVGSADSSITEDFPAGPFGIEFVPFELTPGDGAWLKVAEFLYLSFGRWP